MRRSETTVAARQYGAGLIMRRGIEVRAAMRSVRRRARVAVGDPRRAQLVLVPQPGYPDYNAAATLAGATAIPLVLDPANDYQPDWARVAALEPALVVLNYPANPCTACEKPGTFETAVEYCRTRRAWLMHDFAYGFLSYSGRPRSVLEVEGAREVSVELWSASKIFGTAGWRIGLAVGNAVLIQRVKRLVHQYVAGIWPGFQDGLLAAMNDPARDTHLRIAAYRRRRDLMLAGSALTR